MAQVTDEEKFYDRGNPVHQIRKTMVNGRMSNEDDDFSREKFHELSSSGQSFLPPFNEVDDAAAVYRVNQLYVPDEDEDEEEYFRKPNMDPPAWHEHGIPRYEENVAKAHPAYCLTLLIVFQTHTPSSPKL